MKRVEKLTAGRLGLFALTGLLCGVAVPSVVHADSTEEIINLLKAKNIITAEEAALIIDRHKNDAVQAAAAAAKPKPVTIVLPKGQRTPMATTDPVAQKMIQEEVSRQVKEGLKEEIAKEVTRESSTMAALDWTKKIKFGGDLRVRYQSDMFGEDNGLFLNPTNPTDYNDAWNRQVDRERLLYQARLSANARVNDETEVGLRLSTGNDENPVSTNDTLGDYMNKDTVTFDQAYLKWSPAIDPAVTPLKVDFWGGRMPNPFLATDLVWDSDINFEGVAATLAMPFRSDWKGFVNAGLFPLQEIEFSERDKWLLGGQVGLQYVSRAKITYTLAAAFYDYQNIQGTLNPELTSSDNDVYHQMAPKIHQSGNTYFDVNQGTTSATDDLWNLASDYNEINITGKVDIGIFDPIYISFIGDYVKNIGFDSDEVSALVGEPIAENTTGYLLGTSVGYQKMEKLWDWQVSLAYKYLEADAVVDAFTDSDFQLGGTNGKGWILGGQLGLAKNLWLRARWLSSDEITGETTAIDTLQVDINSRF